MEKTKNKCAPRAARVRDPQRKLRLDLIVREAALPSHYHVGIGECARPHVRAELPPVQAPELRGAHDLAARTLGEAERSAQPRGGEGRHMSLARARPPSPRAARRT